VIKMCSVLHYSAGSSVSNRNW